MDCLGHGEATQRSGASFLCLVRHIFGWCVLVRLVREKELPLNTFRALAKYRLNGGSLEKQKVLVTG